MRSELCITSDNSIYMYCYHLYHYVSPILLFLQYPKYDFANHGCHDVCAGLMLSLPHKQAIALGLHKCHGIHGYGFVNTLYAIQTDSSVWYDNKIRRSVDLICMPFSCQCTKLCSIYMIYGFVPNLLPKPNFRVNKFFASCFTSFHLQ